MSHPLTPNHEKWRRRGNSDLMFPKDLLHASVSTQNMAMTVEGFGDFFVESCVADLEAVLGSNLGSQAHWSIVLHFLGKVTTRRSFGELKLACSCRLLAQERFQD